MASKKVAADGETKDEVIKFESEYSDHGNGMLPHHSSEILDIDIDEEIEFFLKQGLISEQDDVLAVKGIPPKESGVSYIETLLLYMSVGSVFAIIWLGGCG